MFYCEPCAEKNKWPKGLLQSVGKCECCDQPAVCYDVPSSALPKSEMHPQTREEVVNGIHIAATFNTQNTIPHLMQLIGYRQKVAQDLLCAVGDDYDKLFDLLNYTNEQIKKVLGI